MKYPVKTPLVNINAKHNISDGLYDYMKQEIDRLNNIINKAIEYINENDLYTYIPDNDLGMDYNELVNEKLLDILKG